MKTISKYRLIILVITLAFTLFSVLGEQTLMSVMLLVLFVVELIYASKDLNKNIAFILFLVAFFTFLMGRLILPLFINLDDYSEVFFSYMDYKSSTYFHVILSLYITLLFIFVSYTMVEKKMPDSLNLGFFPDSPRIKFVRRCAKIAMWMSFPFALLVILEKVRYVMVNGYAGMLLEQESNLPTIVIILSALFEYMVFLFLATLPTKRESKIVVILYLFFAISNIIGGDRGECVLSVFVVVFYFFLRNRLNTGKSIWIGKRGIWSLVLAAPLAMILLFSIAYLRDSKEFDSDSAGLLIGGFFYQQGASLNVVASAYEDEKNLPKGKYYSIGPIIDYFKINYLSRIVFGTEPYKVGSSDLATKGNSLDSAITYLEAPEFYASGGGMGSSFVAEAYHDFGYIGVILYALLYGFVLASIPKWNSRNVWLSVVALVFLKYIMYAPRARATAFIASAASVSFWPIALVIFIISLHYSPLFNVKKQKGHLY